MYNQEVTELIRENERMKAAFTILLAKFEAAKKDDLHCVLNREDTELLLKVIGMQPKELDVINFEAVEVDG